MDEATSHRVKLLRFPLIFLVLYIHSYVVPVKLGGSTVAVTPATWLVAVQMVWSYGIARTAVPLFFLISGYLYFVGFDGRFGAYRTKTWRRVGTLLVPFLFWNLLVMGLFALGQTIPATAGYFNADNGRILDATPFALADMLFGITHFPIAYQFWFIRDLMVLVLVTPVLHWLLKRTGPLVPGVLSAWWLLHPAVLPFLTVPSLEATTFFAIGAGLAMTGRAPMPPAGWLRWLVPLYGAMLAADVTVRMTSGTQPLFWITVMIGMALMLALTGLVHPEGRVSRALTGLSSASFFVFAAHEPLMTLCRKLIYRTFPATQATLFTAYALLPLALAAALTILYFALRRIAPRFTATIAGGR